jgi:hypothetical protein
VNQMNRASYLQVWIPDDLNTQVRMLMRLLGLGVSEGAAHILKAGVAAILAEQPNLVPLLEQLRESMERIATHRSNSE